MWNWCWRSSACSTIEGARKFLDSRGRDVPSKPAAVTAKAARKQADLFGNPAPILEDIRKELNEILTLLR